jgi:hypothetical protein
VLTDDRIQLFELRTQLSLVALDGADVVAAAADDVVGGTPAGSAGHRSDYSDGDVEVSKSVVSSGLSLVLAPTATWAEHPRRPLPSARHQRNTYWCTVSEPDGFDGSPSAELLGDSENTCRTWPSVE